MAEVDKVVVTNMRALKSKYGRRVRRITAALGELVDADRERGLTTSVVHLDDEAEMARYGAPPVRRSTSPPQAKAAIDGVYRFFEPSYLMILGSVDVVPHQPLKNPKYSKKDSNRIAYSDLPYACETGYSTDIPDFVGPTRSVGRLPDVTGHSDVEYLVGLLHRAAAAKTRRVTGESSCLGISARKWEPSTRRNLAEVFEADMLDRVHCSPRQGPDWDADLMARPVHFINCHGGKSRSDCRYYGEGASKDDIDRFIAHDSACVAGRLTPGTVAVVECCYGARLSDPRDTAGILTICNTYLSAGAVAFFGSSTAAYGGERVIDWADWLCRFFLVRLLRGQTAGDATLGARLDFLDHCDLDPITYKTLAQFSLLGDPSLQPFLEPEEKTEPSEAEARTRRLAGRAARRTAVRADLTARGERLRSRRAVTHAPTHVLDPQATIRQILEAAGAPGWEDPELESFVQSAPDDDAAVGPGLVHVVTRPGRRRARPYMQVELLVARQVGGEIVSVRRAVSR